jgi:hypothetical protein
VTRDFGQAARYHYLVIAAVAPHRLVLGIATVLAAAAWLATPTPPAISAPNVEAPTPVESLGMRWQHEEPVCDRDDVTSIVIRGQFTSPDHHQGFSISFAGSAGRYTAMTDPRGYFEVRIPREDFEGDLCELPLDYRHFSDEQMTLEYRIDIER